MTCVYLGEPIKGEAHACRLHERCLPTGSSRKVRTCDGCNDGLSPDDPEFASKWRDGLIVSDRRGAKTDALRGMLAGRPAFLVGGGPSANECDLSLMNGRGVFSLGVNNVAAHPRFRTNAFVCSDPPSKFHHSIWMDPCIIKLLPKPKLLRSRGKLKRKMPDGTFERLEKRTVDCPNVWGFERHSWMVPDEQFFTDDGAMWGNLNSGVKKTGEKKTVCTLLLGLRLLYYLGARRIYLLGVDFHMRPDWGYSFGQGRTKGACESNNRQFGIVGSWLCKMKDNGVFSKFGLDIYNCYRNSGLRAFPYVPFVDAITDAKGICEDEPDCSEWYEKIPTEDEKKKKAEGEPK